MNKARSHKVTKSMTDVADEEDARLLKEQTVNQSNLDYSDLSRKVLLVCNMARTLPESENSPDKFLRKHKGRQAWGPTVKDET